MTTNPLTMLDSSVQGQGVKVSARDWLDMGSEGWAKVPNRAKAAAYQASKLAGWTDDGLKAVMLKEWSPRVDDDTAIFVLNLLRELAKEYPFDQEVVYQTDPAETVIRRYTGAKNGVADGRKEVAGSDGAEPVHPRVH